MTDAEPRRLIAYCRQSKGREGETRETSLSLESQEEEIRAWGQANGFEVERAIRDHDLVGDDAARPGIAEMEARTAPGVTFAVYKWDRLARDLVLQETIVRAVERRGGAIVSIREPSNKLTRAIFGAVNEDFKDALSERIQAIKKAKAMRGETNAAVAPFGYRRPGVVYIPTPDGGLRERPTGPLEPDETEAAVVREIFERFLGGESLSSLMNELRARSVPRRRGGTWNVGMLTAMIRNPLYAGLVNHRHAIVAEGKHAALIDRETWERANARIDEAATIRRRSPNELASWVEGRIEHACGRRMYLNPVHAVRKSGKHTIRGNFICRSGTSVDQKCPFQRRMMIERKVERTARACLLMDLARLASLDEALERAEARAGGDLADRQRAAIATKRAAAERRRARARESWMDGLDELEVWQAEHARYLAAIAELDRDLARLPVAPDAARYRDAAASLTAYAAMIARADDVALGAILEAVGTVVVSEAGVSIRYRDAIADFIPCPVTLADAPKTL